MDGLKKHLSVANVLSCLALFMAISGVAYAAIGKNAVKTRNIAKGAVTTQKLRNRAVKASKLANGAVIGSKLRNEAVGTAKLARASVRSSTLGGGVVTTAKLKSLAVTEGKLANNAVGNSKLGPDSVATGKVQDGAITGAKLASSFLAQLVKNISYATKTSTLSDSSTPKEATVECPGGKVAIGGGAKVIGGTFVALTDSAFTPPNAEDKRIGWTAAAAEMAVDASNWSLEVHVVCAEL